MAKRIKIPKRVAGVKVPKPIRKGPIADFLNSTAGQVLLAEALIAAAGLFAAKRINDEDAGEVLRHPLDSLQRAGLRVGARIHDSGEAIHRNTARLQFALGEGVRAFREALAEPSEVSPVGEAVRTDEPDAGKKKNRAPSDQSAAH
jgi:hypothetical protein